MGDQQQSLGDNRESKGQNFENLARKTMKIGTECDIDWISKLPDALIIEILSLMPILDAYKTTILSKRWKNMWTYIDNVVFGDKISWYTITEYDKDMDNLISFMDNALCLLYFSKIKKFSLRFSFHLDEDYRYKMDKWIESSVKKNVKEVRLDVAVHKKGHKVYKLPQVLCSSSSLEKLECWSCYVSKACKINWISLKSLTLNNLRLTDKDIAKIISGSPVLECLELRGFTGLRHLRMTSPRCRRLELDNLRCRHTNWSLEIVAPYVQHLKISGELKQNKVTLRGMSSLVYAELMFLPYNMLRETKYERLKDMVKYLRESICCANELTLISWFIEVVSMLEMEGFRFPLLECKRLIVSSSFGSYPILGMGTFLKSAPHLENLEIRAQYYVDIDYTLRRYWRKAVDSAGDNRLSLQEKMLKDSVQNLKKVKIIPMFCYSAKRNKVAEIFELVKSLLKHAIALEKLVIVPFHRGGCDICSTHLSKMAEDSLSFARASLSVVVSFEC